MAENEKIIIIDQLKKTSTDGESKPIGSFFKNVLGDSGDNSENKYYSLQHVISRLKDFFDNGHFVRMSASDPVSLNVKLWYGLPFDITNADFTFIWSDGEETQNIRTFDSIDAYNNANPIKAIKITNNGETKTLYNGDDFKISSEIGNNNSRNYYVSSLKSEYDFYRQIATVANAVLLVKEISEISLIEDSATGELYFELTLVYNDGTSKTINSHEEGWTINGLSFSMDNINSREDITDAEDDENYYYSNNIVDFPITFTKTGDDTVNGNSISTIMYLNWDSNSNKYTLTSNMQYTSNV